MKYLSIILLLCLTQGVFAKRLAPAEVESVTYDGVVYSVLKWGKVKGLDQNGGYLIAKDKKTKKVLWQKRIYKIKYSKQLETDIQDIFITKLSLSDDKKDLVINNERGETYHLNLKTKEVIHVIN